MAPACSRVSQELVHDLAQDDEEGKDRMLPVAVVAVASGGDGLRGPLQAFEEGPGRPFQVLHAHHVEGGHDDHGGRQGGHEQEQALRGAREGTGHLQTASR